MDENKTPAPGEKQPAPTDKAPAYDGMETIKAFYDGEIKRLQNDLAASVEREKQKDAIISQFVKGGAPNNTAPAFNNNADPVAGAVNLLQERYNRK